MNPDEEPDVLLYSCWGMNNLRWRNSIRIYFTAEQDIPDFNLCDYAIGLSYVGMPSRFLHFPFYVFYNDLIRKLENKSFQSYDQQFLNRKFCSTVISGPMRHPIYFEIVNQLNNYKRVDSGGKRFNNIGGSVSDKISFIQNYKFNLAIENLNVNGYITEKIPEAFVAQTLPVYWGSDTVKKEFGEGGYINISDFESIEKAIQFIKEVDNDDELYLKILKRGAQPIFTYDQWCEKLFDFLVNAIQHGKQIYDSGMYNVIYNERLFYYKIRNSFPGLVYRKYQRMNSAIREYLKTQKFL
ncbi:MAG: hypothetical protein J1F31_05605 [Erysipelotrichales bacterium]|nr:hypothetical protein [Erysipelotrichales bacterium]